jgi:hypothetical protein
MVTWIAYKDTTPLFCNERVVTRETEKKKGRIIYWTALMVMG